MTKRVDRERGMDSDRQRAAVVVLRLQILLLASIQPVVRALSTLQQHRKARLRARALRALRWQCVGSGFCCKTGPCEIASEKYGLQPWIEKKGCPSLRFDEQSDRYFCGEVLDATGAWRAQIEKLLHIGAGCCSTLNSDRLTKIKRLKERL